MSEKNSSAENHINDDVVLGKNFSNMQRALAYFAVAVVYFFYCYNFTVGTFIKPTMIKSISEGGFGFTLTQTEQIFASMTMGMIIGAILFGKLSSIIGKKRTYIIVALSIAGFTYLPLLSPTSFSLWFVSRAIVGLVLGGVFGIAMPLVADIFPEKYRGKLAASLTALFSVAMIFGGQVYGALGDENWKILMMTVIIPPIVGAILVFFFVPDDFAYMKKLRDESEAAGEKISYLSMYKGTYLWIGLGTILLSGLNFIAANTFMNNSTTYLVTVLGVSSATAGSIYSIQGFGQLAGYFAWGAVADKFGRKVPLIGMGLYAILLFVYTKLSGDNPSVFFVIAPLMGFCIGCSGAWGAYYSELFPDKFRSLSAGLSFNGGRIISAIGQPLAVSTANGSMGMVAVFYSAMAAAIAATITWAFLPETMKSKVKTLTKKMG